MSKKFSPEWWASLRPEQVGKETEKLVEALFKQWNLDRADFAWHRLPDSKSSRGMVAAQPADYLFRNGQCGASGFVEVKALKHPYRLPSARVTQLPVLKKWGAAGSSDVVLVHHYIEGRWRAVPVAQLEFSVASWDLRALKDYSTAREALVETGLFPDTLNGE